MRVVFVCTGNICRSPMAERVARGRASEAGLGGVEFSSVGTSAEEQGNPMDPRARRVLRLAGYDPEGHVARQLSADEAKDVDLFVAAERHHADRIARIAPGAEIRLLSEFVPDAEEGSGLPDPWYGPDSGFRDTLTAVEAAMPALFDEIRGRGQR